MGIIPLSREFHLPINSVLKPIDFKEVAGLRGPKNSMEVLEMVEGEPCIWGQGRSRPPEFTFSVYDIKLLEFLGIHILKIK